ncbi:GNAT family N-acetyltransferase [Haloarchaeobius iranensis]|uniref:Acetyltransferase (GNAT) family protein n=1 Tax=Haloarchaeobius iranensis TaxID=996166 RepID=A0A1G9WV13_9EURY|nr:GNAT family N-acetyltransferase [Haloarchaeobius iranensis]SDM88392.1 Acetyltransferase (GNAT) family protein [Haloarchaeobius iranensis]
MHDSLSVRGAGGDDARAVQRVADAACHAVYDDILGPGVVDDIIVNWYDPDRLVADDIEPDARPFLVAAVDDAVVGFVEGVPDDDEADVAHLYRIYVHPDYWGDGVGRALLDRLEAVFRDRGFDRLRVSVFAENDVGVRFYESVGFGDRRTATDEQFDTERYEYEKSPG